jgi:hypothetical protein
MSPTARCDTTTRTAVTVVPQTSVHSIVNHEWNVIVLVLQQGRAGNETVHGIVTRLVNALLATAS